MDFITKNRDIPYISPILLDNLGFISKNRSNSNLKVNPTYTVKKGTFIRCEKKGVTRKLYGMATGEIIDKDNIKYYEVYPELYTLDQCRLIYWAKENLLEK